MSAAISGVVFGSFWLMLPGLGATTRPSILLKFSLETRLESKSLEPLINFIAFLVQTLRSEIKKLINYLMK